MKINKTIIVSLIMIGILGLIFLASSGSNRPKSTVNELVGGEEFVIYKSPNCGCCGVYSSYLEREGVSVDVRNVTNMNEVKTRLNIPLELQSCHTTEVGGYVVEGHIPLEVINKLLTEKPQIQGIALPGMPSGSPGMPGPKASPFVIYTLGGSEGEIYMTI
ncbi:MAG: hypothetical protein NUV96_01010 [Candidatus Colwellbacteria bacterium]|nr:hypothetical protein [Candidatus Colwellbacteria bacterium]